MDIDNIKGIKLMNGAEIIAKVVSVSSDTYELHDAVFWDLVEVSKQQYDVKFFPLTTGANLSLSETHFAMDVSIQKNSVFFEYALNPNILAKYKQFISPIVLLNK